MTTIVNPHRYPTSWIKVARIIRRLANHHCQQCGIRSNRLSVHHLGVPLATGDGWRPGNPKDKHDLRLENLIALCEECHRQIDHGRIRYQKMENKRRAKFEKHRALGIGTGLALCTHRAMIVLSGGES